MNSAIRRMLGRRSQRRVRLPGLGAFLIETHGRTDEIVSRNIDDWGVWEPNCTAVLRQLFSTPVDFIDIGANIGWHTVVAAISLAGRGHVHSFEPDPAHLSKLTANVATNKLTNVTVIACALSDRMVQAPLYLNETNRGDNSIFRAGTRLRSVEVQLRRLDDYGDVSVDRPLVVKIDVQGAEIEVLRGAGELLAGHPRDVVILCEFSPEHLSDGSHSTAELCAELSRQGFSAALVDPKGCGIVPVSWERLAKFETLAHTYGLGSQADVLAFRRIDGLMAPFFKPVPR